MVAGQTLQSISVRRPVESVRGLGVGPQVTFAHFLEDYIISDNHVCMMTFYFMIIKHAFALSGAHQAHLLSILRPPWPNQPVQYPPKLLAVG